MSDSISSFGFCCHPYSNALGNQSELLLGTECAADHTLRLDSPYYHVSKCSSLIGIKRKWCECSGAVRDPGNLALGLGHSLSCSSISKGSSGTTCTATSARVATDEESSIDLGLDVQLHLGHSNILGSTVYSMDAPLTTEVKPNLDIQLSLYTGLSESVSSVTVVPFPQKNSMDMELMNSVKTPDEDGSASSSNWKLQSNYVPSFKTSEITCRTANHKLSRFSHIQTVPELSPTTLTTTKSSVTCTSGCVQPQQRNTSNKTCQFQGCTKGARGASGLCIAHGGGRRCQKAGCRKGAEGKTVYCKAHGGGRRCQFLGCTKSAEGRTEYCIAHGGGRRCSHEGCIRAARGKSGLCIRHGGGKRCQRENCTKSAEGYSGLCISHGGGRRCQYHTCTKGAQGSTMFCKAHGGGKRCTVLGCTKGAEGSTPFCKGHGGGKRCSFQGGGVCPKSVHGGTLFCVAHGGGKRCAFHDCSKSARGRTDFCVKHGGGKRCKSEGCAKSAQGSTDFCKAHGGGKRCSWGQPGSKYGALSSRCDRFARGKVGLCAAHGALLQDHCVRGGGTLRPPSSQQRTVPIKQESIKHAPVCVMSSTRRSRLDHFLGINSEEIKGLHEPMNDHHSEIDGLPEGRVHGGRLMAMLSCCSDAGHSSSSQEIATHEKSMAYAMLHEWI